MKDAHRRFFERKRCEKAGIPVPEWAQKTGRVSNRPPVVEERPRLSAVRALPAPLPEPEVKCGDARELIKKVPLDAFLICDPPYNQGYHYDVYEDRLPSHSYMELLRCIFQGRRSVLVHYPEETINVFSKLGLGDVQDVMAWIYPSNQPKQHRLATWWGCAPDWTRTPQAYRNPGDKRVAALMAAGKQARGYDWVEINHVKNVANAGHPCPLPYELAERLVLATTNPGDLVCDPFAGSGTVLLAAKRNGRRVVGFDLSADYCRVAQRNLDDSAMQGALGLVR